MRFRPTLLGLSGGAGALRRGDRLEHFEIVEPIASGGFGDVYRGLDLSLKRPVAIKVLRAQHLNDPDLRARFVREAQLLAKVDNPHVVKVFFAGQQREMAYLVMELIQGNTLSSYMTAEEPLPISDALFLAARIANGVAAAHDAGIVHRDLKPDNVLITSDLQIKVGDFGTAKALNEARSEKLIGTLAYMSPEHFERKVQLDERADIRSIGLILYLMLSGKQAYTKAPGMELPEFMLKVATQPPPDPTRYARYLVEYEYVLSIVWKAIHRDRTQRHATAHELEAECLEAKEQLHREASPARAKRLARIDARAPYLVADTAPRLMIRPQRTPLPTEARTVSCTPAPEPAPAMRMARPAAAPSTQTRTAPLDRRSAKPSALTWRVVAVLGILSLSPALVLVGRHLAQRAPQLGREEAGAHASLNTIKQPSTASHGLQTPLTVPHSTDTATPMAAVQPSKPVALPVPTEPSPAILVPKSIAIQPVQATSKAARSPGRAPAAPPSRVVLQPGGPRASQEPDTKPLPKPAAEAPGSVADGCDHTKQRCTIY